MKIETYNIKGEKAGVTELPERIFGAKWNQALVRQVYDGEMANKRRPWAHAKGRGEVRGGGRKPWRQKHLGRARHGSIRSPIWTGGGVTHGPLKERDYSVKINKKMKRGALFSLLSRKAKDKEVILLDLFNLSSPKTKEMAAIFKNLREAANIYRLGVKGGRALLAVIKNGELKRAAGNLPFVVFAEPRNLNVVSLLNHKYLVLDKNSVKELESNWK